MTDREIKILNRIPKKYREHITNLSISETNNYNNRGQMLYDYTITYDNGTEVIFDNQKYMLFMLKEYSVNGYYVAP